MIHSITICGDCGKPLVFTETSKERKSAKCCGREYSMTTVFVGEQSLDRPVAERHDDGFQRAAARALIDREYNGSRRDTFA